MPELPEVETLRRELDKKLQGKKIAQVEVFWAGAIKPATAKKFKKIVTGRKILEVNRRAKILLVSLNDNSKLAIHLKMTGQLVFTPKVGRLIVGGHPTDKLEMPGKHTRLVFHFTDQSKLYFNDLRKFGWVKILDEELKKYIDTELGIEPLSAKCTMVHFKKIFKKYPNRTVKQILLDQKLIAGIGNIYADETCFLAGILPWRKAKTLTEREIKKIKAKIIAVLNKSLRYGGTSARDYVRSDGIPGGFAPHLTVYGRAGLSCKTCGTLIQKTKHVGRGTHFCPKCQR